ncbi:MAG: TPM domain-containing protein [Candidatus Eremiobacteraeota bacterium]|nr:TPM domain-containing protein [Candidatus Eremiobacteraeota bacterium]
MKAFLAFAALTVLIGGTSFPALARDSFIKDDAGVFSAATVSALNSRIASFNAQTGKDIVVATVPSLQGSTLTDAAERSFAQQQVNGVLIFISKGDRKDIVIPDSAGARAGWFTSDTTRTIRQAMEAQFRDGDFDRGITTGVGLVLNTYRQHLGALHGAGAPVNSYSRRPVSAPAQTGGFHLNFFWWIVILVAGFLIVRSLLRAMSAPRRYPPAAGQAGQAGPGPAGGAGYGGYGPGGGGGGGFFSGLLGGLGGAFLGNELFGNRGAGLGGGVDQGGSYGAPEGGGAADPGWASDAGQADTGAASGGDWGGGGFDSGGGGGDFGGGGGDSGGGW